MIELQLVHSAHPLSKSAHSIPSASFLNNWSSSSLNTVSQESPAPPTSHEDSLFEFATTGEKGMMMKNRSMPDQILKPVRANEFNFYETVYPNCPQIQRFAPKYFGFKMKERPLVKLEDLTARYKRANILDIKMGHSTAGEKESDEKKEYRRKKDGATTSLPLAMRYAGLWLFDPETRDYHIKDKIWGKRLEAKDFFSTLDMYVSNQGKNSIEKRIGLIDKWMTKLEAIKQWIDSPNAQFRMYSSSLMFIYEGDDLDDVSCDLRMIDFSHVYPIRDGGRDDGYIKGLNNLMSYLADLKDMYTLSMHSEAGFDLEGEPLNIKDMSARPPE
ncbi:hypothetical protein PROFUN_01721 [Planoprotostelium fungivorum]|uniref:Kinase n=1 Tax=Planoprotostelium fungivorum TaxID=1890364 RepID=A0A2P6MWC9_9EUKA|nr:hypothetical protein PROFUN_01721 [Planoprotostelium fungivorum]